MEIGTPFIIDTTEEHPQNNNLGNYSTECGNSGYNADRFAPNEDVAVPFEFSRSRMWSENFYSPEIGAGHSIASLEKELCEIKQLIADIKDMLKNLFEIQ